MPVYEMKFEIDEPQFTQREVLGVIDLPATTLNTWNRSDRSMLEPFEFERYFGTESERMADLIANQPPGDKLRTYKVFAHSDPTRKRHLYSILDVLCLGGIKAVLDANIEIRFAYQFPVLLCDLWTDIQLINLHRHSFFDCPIVLYVDDGELFALYPKPTQRTGSDTLKTERDHGHIDPKLNAADLLAEMRTAQLTTVTMLDWPAIEEKVIDRLKGIISVRGHRDWRTEKEQ